MHFILNSVKSNFVSEPVINSFNISNNVQKYIYIYIHIYIVMMFMMCFIRILKQFIDCSLAICILNVNIFMLKHHSNIIPRPSLEGLNIVLLDYNTMQL